MTMIYQNELDKACYQHAIAYGHFKYLPRRTVSDNIAKIKNLMEPYFNG